MPAQRSDQPEWTQALSELGQTVRTMARGISRRRGRDTHLAGTEVGHAQFELLLELHDRGELAAGELATAAGLTPATVTQMLDHLAERGFVERSRSDSDRRVVVSRLTGEGLRLMLARKREWHGRWEAAMNEFSAAEMRTAARVLGKLCAVFAEGASPSAEGCAERSQLDGESARAPASGAASDRS